MQTGFCQKLTICRRPFACMVSMPLSTCTKNSAGNNFTLGKSSFVIVCYNDKRSESDFSSQIPSNTKRFRMWHRMRPKRQKWQQTMCGSRLLYGVKRRGEPDVLGNTTSALWATPYTPPKAVACLVIVSLSGSRSITSVASSRRATASRRLTAFSNMPCPQVDSPITGQQS